MYGINYGCKKFYDTGPWAIVYKFVNFFSNFLAKAWRHDIQHNDMLHHDRQGHLE